MEQDNRKVLLNLFGTGIVVDLKKASIIALKLAQMRIGRGRKK